MKKYNLTGKSLERYNMICPEGAGRRSQGSVEKSEEGNSSEERQRKTVAGELPLGCLQKTGQHARIYDQIDKLKEDNL